jgi:hypothetical protein
MRRLLAAAILAIAAMPASLAAHRLDEYLQAARVEVARDHIVLEVDLTPGSSIASGVITTLDRDADGTIAPLEARAYGRSVLSDLTLELDGRRIDVALTRIEVPTLGEMRDGMGAIRLKAQAVAASPAGRRVLYLRNDHQPASSVYLANALVPQDGDLHVLSQTRDPRQQSLRIEYSVEPAWPVKMAWLIVPIMGLALRLRGRFSSV